MADEKKIKERIQATEKTYQITNAMNMVSTSKLRKAQKSLISFRPISDEILKLTRELVLSNPDLHHKAFSLNKNNKPCYIIIASDRGLIGSYNNSIFKHFKEYVEAHHKKNDEFVVATIGFKAFSFAKKMGYNLINDESANVRDDVLFVDFAEVSKTVLEEYMNDKLGKTIVFFNSFVNTMSSNISEIQLLPIEFSGEVTQSEYVFEPSKKEILSDLVHLYVDYTLYRIILEAKASEHASRMTAMKNASDNAKEIEKKLTLLYNRARQNSITTELIDVINGSNAVN